MLIAWKSDHFLGYLRGWVGVEIEVSKKMAVSLALQGFGGYWLKKRSAHLTGTGFQRFLTCAIAIPRVMISSSAQPHLENQIKQGFQPSGVTNSQNPY